MKIPVVIAASAAALTLVCTSFAADKPKAGDQSTNKTAAAASSATKSNDVVARVNGTEIKRKELDADVQAFAHQMAQGGNPIPPSQTPELEHEVLEDLIGRELFLQEGNKHIPLDIDKKVQEQMDQMKTQLGGEEEVKRMLAESGITPEEYAVRVRDDIIIHNAIRAAIDTQVKISPEDIKAFYDKNPDMFKQPEMVRASQIFVPCAPDATEEVKKAKRAQIDAALALVKGGSKFSDVAKKFSEDPTTAETGGDLGYFPHGLPHRVGNTTLRGAGLGPEVDTAAFSMKTNEISGVITSQLGYHIIQVTDRKPAQTMAFDQVKDRLGDALKQRKSNEAARDHVAELRKAAKVEVYLAPLPATPMVDTPPMQAPSK